jgi:hypothetical protein
MANYDINGTIFYNPDFKHRFGVSGWSRVAAAWLGLMDVPAGLNEREALLWREHLKDSRAMARNGAVQALAIRPGRLAARVEDPISKAAHTVKIIAPVAAPSVWAELAAQAERGAQLAAQIADGAVPQAFEPSLMLTREAVTFEADGVVLAPTQRPQSLIATAWLAFAERIHVDPWLWVLFRGQTREGLLDLVRSRQREQAQAQAKQANHWERFKLSSFWVTGELPAPGTPSAGQPRVLAQLRKADVDIRVGRRKLGQVLVRAMKPE